MNRREFATLLGGFAFAPQAPAPRSLPDRGFAKVEKVADGVYATIADFSKGRQALSNGGLIVGRKAVLLIEGHASADGAQLEIEAARELSKAPIHAAVNTHYHWDHTFGNSAYARQSIAIIAHEEVGKLMKERYASLKGKDKKEMLAPFEKRLADAPNAEEKKRAEGDLGLVKALAESIDATEFAYPTQSIASGTANHRIDLGGLTAVIEHHPGHTTNDLVVRVPERDVVFAGDLLFNGAYPVAMDANMKSWRRALELLAGARAGRKFVPGHGAVGGPDAVRTQIAVMDDLRAHAEKMKSAGVDADAAQRRYQVPPKFQSLGVFSWALSIGAAIQKYYTEL